MKKIILLLIITPLFIKSQIEKKTDSLIEIEKKTDSLIEIEYLEFKPIELIEPLKLELQKNNKGKVKDSLVEIELFEVLQFEPIPYYKIIEADSLKKPLLLKFFPKFKNKSNFSDTLLEIELMEYSQMMALEITLDSLIEPMPYLPYYKLIKSDSLNEPLLLKFFPKFKRKYNPSDTLIELKPIEIIEPIEAIEIPVLIKIKHQK